MSFTADIYICLDIPSPFAEQVRDTHLNALALVQSHLASPE